jgi:hypothetical protein
MSLQQRIRIWGIVSYVATERSEYAHLGFENYRALTVSGSGGIANAHMRKGNGDPAASGYLALVGVNAANTFYSSTDNAANDVVVVELVGSDLTTMFVYTGASVAGAFPAASALNPMGVVKYAPGGLRNAGLATADSLAVFFASGGSNVYVGVITATLARLKIEVL